jgi:hypothetical protein
MESEITINAEGLTKVATHLRTTLFEMSKTVEKFDNTSCALMQYGETFIDRFEAAVARLEKLNATLLSSDRL